MTPPPTPKNHINVIDPHFLRLYHLCLPSLTLPYLFHISLPYLFPRFSLTLSHLISFLLLFRSVRLLHRGQGRGAERHRGVQEGAVEAGRQGRRRLLRMSATVGSSCIGFLVHPHSCIYLAKMVWITFWLLCGCSQRGPSSWMEHDAETLGVSAFDG